MYISNPDEVSSSDIQSQFVLDTFEQLLQNLFIHFNLFIKLAILSTLLFTLPIPPEHMVWGVSSCQLPLQVLARGGYYLGQPAHIIYKLMDTV